MGLVDICLQPSPRPSISSELPRSFLFPPPKMHIPADFGSLLAVPLCNHGFRPVFFTPWGFLSRKRNS